MSAPSLDATSLDVIRTRFGPLELAIELHQVNSVLDYREGQGLPLVDPAPRLGLRPLGRGHVAYMEPEAGPPVGVLIGEVLGFEKWTPANIIALPDWIASYLPDVLASACGSDERGDIVWLMDLRRVTQQNG